jgi:hypothetical protein
LTRINLIFARAWDNPRMAPVRYRPLAWLALVAMLALALLPTLGRLGGTVPSHPGMAAADAAHAMHAHMPGMHMPGMDMHMASQGQQLHGAGTPAHPAPPDGHEGHDGHDCTYCLLLSGLVGTAALQWLPPATFVATRLSTGAVANRATDAPVPALGAQGPPASEVG